MSEALVPQLRFEGFDDEWRLVPFNEFASRQTSGAMSGVLPAVEYEDIDSGYGTVRQPLDRKSSKKAGIAFIAGDVLFGKLRPYLRNWLLPDFDGVAVGDFWVLRPKVEPAFLYALIQGSAFTEVSSISSGSKMPRSDWGIVSSSSFAMASWQEQVKVGCALQDVDSLISRHRRKHAQLQQAKTALMQRMFPQDGADEPELRLEGFSGAWETSLLGQLANMYQPKTISRQDFTDVGVPVFGANGYVGFYSEANHWDDQVTISARGEKVGAPSYVVAPVWITGNSMVIDVDPTETDKYFLYTAFQANPVRKWRTGGAQPQLTREILVAIPLAYPDVMEQRAIGAFFSKLDGLITAEQQYVHKLQQVKSALLQKMFV